jgi:hypothetical protein
LASGVGTSSGSGSGTFFALLDCLFFAGSAGTGSEVSAVRFERVLAIVVTVRLGFTATGSILRSLTIHSSRIVAVMFRPAYPLRAILPRARINQLSANFTSTPVVPADQPNEPLDLDPSFKALLRDVDISLLKHKQNSHSAVLPPRALPKELETVPFEFEEGEERGISVHVNEGVEVGEEDYHAGPRDARKSPAALFGSQSIGQVVLPFELQKSINLLISGEPHTHPLNHSQSTVLVLRIGQNDAPQ